jgi:hypothetical protein
MIGTSVRTSGGLRGGSQVSSNLCDPTIRCSAPNQIFGVLLMSIWFFPSSNMVSDPNEPHMRFLIFLRNQVIFGVIYYHILQLRRNIRRIARFLYHIQVDCQKYRRMPRSIYFHCSFLANFTKPFYGRSSR